MNWSGRLLLSPGDRVAGYEVDSYVARGGMAVVYRARDVSLGRWVALKVIAPEWTDNDKFKLRFMRESEMAAAIDHPNIVPIYQAGEADGLLYIAMRFVEGQDLGKVMAASAPLSPGVVLPLFTQIAGALDTAHANGLVHRDVKPGNVLLSSGAGAGALAESHVYLTDFGLTKRSSSHSGLTTVGHFMGTISYVAPEQIAGTAVDHRADIYAMGCVLYEALAGVPPFQREDDRALLWAHMSVEPDPISSVRPGLPPAVDGVLARALAKEPDQRTQSCRAVVAELRSAFRGEPAAGGRPAPVAVSRPPSPASVQGAPTYLVGQPRNSPRSGPQQPPGDLEPPVDTGAGPGTVDGEVGAPTRVRWLRVGAVAAVIALLAVIGTAFAVWQGRKGEMVAYDGNAAHAEWFTAELPSRWGKHATSLGMCFCSAHLGPAIETGDTKTWSRIDALADHDPGIVDGMYVRETQETGPNSAAAATDYVQSQLRDSHLQLDGQVQRVEISGSPGWRVDGTMESAVNPDTRLAFHYYLIARENGSLDRMVFFTRSDRGGTFMTAAGTIIRSIRLD